MGDVVNLRRQRKARAKAEKDERAHDNRVRHGLSKARKSQATRQNELERKRLDNKTTRHDDD